jgi:hypothetical protein
MTTKEKQIVRIKSIIIEWGSTTSSELGLQASPCVNSIDAGKHGIVQLVEGFNADDVDTVTYDDEIELSKDSIAYENLSEELINEIYNIIEAYENENIKTLNSCKNENI